MSPSEPQYHSEDIDVLRATPEYRAAWEVELWKRREEAAFARRLEEQMKTAVEARLEALRAREAEMEDAHREKMRNITKLEERRLREQSELREKKQMMEDCGKAIRKKKEELEREYTFRKQECDQKLLRTKEEGLHRVAMEQLKHSQLTATVEELRHKLKTVEAQHQTLWDEVTASKKAELLRHPADAIQDAVSAADDKSNKLLATVRSTASAREEALLKKVSSLTATNTRLRERVRHVEAELSTSKGRAAQADHDAALLSAEALSLTRKVQDSVVGEGKATGGVGSAGGAAAGGGGGGGAAEAVIEALQVLSAMPLMAPLTPSAVERFTPQQQAAFFEAARLEKEKRALLNTRCYGEQDSVVATILLEQRKLLQVLIS